MVEVGGYVLFDEEDNEHRCSSSKVSVRNEFPVSDKVFYHVSRKPANKDCNKCSQDCMPLSPTDLALARAEDGLQQIMYYMQLKLSET